MGCVTKLLGAPPDMGQKEAWSLQLIHTSFTYGN